MIRIFAILLSILTLMSASPAHAGPLAPLVPIIVGATIKSAILKIALTLAATTALSMMSKAKKSRAPGIMIEQTLQGGTNPRTIVFGLYCTAGSEPTPPMSYGVVNKTPNSRLVKIIALADVPTDGLSRVIINGEYCPLTSAGGNKWNIGGKYEGHATVTFYDGRQVAADATLVAQFASYPNRPWTAQRIGTGVTYAWFEFLYNTDIFKNEPQVRVELRGMRLYDVRKDSTAGGSGAHRRNDPSTWEFTLNNAVMIYNIFMGIDLPDGTRWGGECTHDDLPVANWAAAMNACDESVETTTGTEPQYRAGYEFGLDREPADVVEELLKGCSGQVVESAGVYKIRCGSPSLPVMFFTDEDFLVTKEQEYDPFPGIGQSRNTVNAVFPHPDELWQQHDAPQFQDPAYVARDEGMEIVADLQFPATPFPQQVQRIMRSWLEDDQRWRRHTGTLPHNAFALEPLDTIAWSSQRNGYIDKLFEIGFVSVNLYSLLVNIAMREVDPDDYDWSPDFELPDPITPGSWELPEEQAVPGFAVAAWSVRDADSDARRPAVRCTWDIEGAVDAYALRIDVRLVATGEIVAGVTVANVGNGEHIISEGILPSTSYEVRARYLVERPTIWTVWHGVTTGNIRLGPKDFDYDALVESFGPSIVTPLITRPLNQMIMQQIRDAAGNDLSFRSANLDEIKNTAGVFKNVAAIYREEQLRLTADEAFASTFEALIADIEGNTAAIANEQIVRADADTVLAGSVTTVTGRLNNAGGVGVTVEQSFIVQGSLIDGLSGQYILRINNNGRISGFGLASGAGGTSEFAILADRFVVTDPANNTTIGYPFQVIGGGVYIRKAFIQTITADQIGANQITAGHISVSSLSAISATMGDLDIRPVVGAGGRIRIFDESDVLRVEIGRLS